MRRSERSRWRKTPRNGVDGGSRRCHPPQPPPQPLAGIEGRGPPSGLPRFAVPVAARSRSPLHAAPIVAVASSAFPGVSGRGEARGGGLHPDFHSRSPLRTRGVAGRAWTVGAVNAGDWEGGVRWSDTHQSQMRLLPRPCLVNFEFYLQNESKFAKNFAFQPCSDSTGAAAWRCHLEVKSGSP